MGPGIPSSDDDEHTKIVADEILRTHKRKIEEKARTLESCIQALKKMDHAPWHREGQELVRWMNREADSMAHAEKDVAITKVTGGGVAILGGVLTGVGAVASFYTFGLAAPMAVAGVVLTASGGVTAAGGGIAQMSIVHMKTHDIHKRCERFAQSTERVLSLLLEIRLVMEELAGLCKQGKQSYPKADERAIFQIILRSANRVVHLAHETVEVYRMGMVIYDVVQLQRSGFILGNQMLKLAAGRVTRTGLSVTKAVLKGSGAVVGIGFGIWDVVDGAGTLQNGGSSAALIRDNAKQIDTTINDIVNALRTLEVYRVA